MNEKTYRINGKVVDENKRKGIGGLLIKAWDKDIFQNDLLGIGTADNEGNFVIEFKSSFFRDFFLEFKPDLFFTIEKNNELIYTTRNSILWNVSKYEIGVTIRIGGAICVCEGEVITDENILRVFGIVSDELNKPVADVTVKAYKVRQVQGEHPELSATEFVRNGLLYTLLGEQDTGDKGQYRIDFNKAEHFGASLVVEVYDNKNKRIGKSGQSTVEARETEINITIKALQYRVYGTVLDGQGKPLKNHIIRAYDLDLRSEELLGETRTDETGFYEINYEPEQFKRSEKGLADLVVKVIDNNGTIIPSNIIYNAPPETVVNINLPGVDPRGLSEFDNLVREITPLLRDIPQDELTDDDIVFLSADTNMDSRFIRWLAESARLYKEAAIIEQFAFYGLLRQNLPSLLNDLLDIEISALRDALDKSSQDHFIKFLTREEIDSIIAKLQTLKIDRAIKPGGGGEDTLGDLLRTVLHDVNKIHTVANLYISNSNSVSEEFLTGLRGQDQITNQEKTDVVLALQLGELTGRFLPLVRELISMAKTDNLYAPTGDLSPYVRLKLDDWKEVLHRKQPNGIIGTPNTIEGNDIEEKIHDYALKLSQQLEKAFPVENIVRRIEQDDRVDSPFLESRADMLTFFDNNPQFNFLMQPLDIYLSTSSEARLTGVKNVEAFKSTLKSIQRVSKLTSDYPALSKLIADGFTSAQLMVNAGQYNFVTQYSAFLGGKVFALSAYLTAQHIHWTAMSVFMNNAPAFRAPLPYVITGRSASERPPEVNPFSFKILANWTKLFGSLEQCECRHCRSLYSPAAYFVDTLNFIKKSTETCRRNALEDLLIRRPDIEHIELTCDNSNTQMPYVDLVNEILEKSIAQTRIELPRKQSIITSLDKQQIHGDLKAALESKNYMLTDKASLRVSNMVGNWIILDSSWVFKINDNPEEVLIIVDAWPQTSWTTKELKANPEHLNNAAYNKLRSAVYPWRLPFSLPVEETRLYLQHLAVRRHEIMEIYFPGAVQGIVSDSKIAYEYIGAISEEADIINGNTLNGATDGNKNPAPWDFWGLKENGNAITDPADNSEGEVNGTWSTVLSRVSIFLQRSGLSYREMLNLLESRFVNPIVDVASNKRSLVIVSTDQNNQTTCNTSKLKLSAPIGTLEETFKKAHRFVRLTRKLGWDMCDLDKAIVALKPKNLNNETDLTEGFLVQLSHIKRLTNEKQVGVVNLLSFWADIDYTPYFDHTTDGEPVIPSLYTQMFLSKTLEAQGFPQNPLQFGNKKIAENTANIAAAFGISTDEVQQLHSDTLIIPTVPDPKNNANLIQDDNLNLANLSMLYRHSLLAKLVRLTIPQYLITLRLLTNNPFESTTKTLQYVKTVQDVFSSGFTVDDLDYLLRHNPKSNSQLLITDKDIETVLNTLRTDIRQIIVDNTFIPEGSENNVATTDPDGELTRKKLSLLNWDVTEIDTVIAVLKNTYVFEVELDSLNAAIKFPVNLVNRISYDADKQRLQFKGAMSNEEKANLLKGGNNSDAKFKKAVNKLYETPKRLLGRQLGRFSVLMSESDEFPLPDAVQFTNALKSRIFYDTATKKLRFIGVMTLAEKDLLSSLSNDEKYTQAIFKLYDAPTNIPLDDSDKFLAESDINALFDDPQTKPGQRFAIVLQKLMPHLLKKLSERIVNQRLTEYAGLESSTVFSLLNRWVKVPETGLANPPAAMKPFVEPLFTDSNPELQITPTAFPEQFNTFLLLHKISALIGKFAYSQEMVKAIFENGKILGWLDLNQLPLKFVDDNPTLFAGWMHLADLARLRETLPNGTLAVDEWLIAINSPNAQVATIIDTLSRGTRWSLSDLQTLVGATGFNFDRDALSSEIKLLRIADAMAMIKKLHATAGQCLAWTKEAVGDAAFTRDSTQAQDIKNLVRAKYSPIQWYELAGNLRDPLREKQRGVLVDYLLAQSGLADTNALYAYLLIDVEMNPCMMTTRIKQAISSVQLYIQRTLMNLEKCAHLTPQQAKEWATWRKQYRVWEANRKVLLYPENWIEPELRDNKTPFFKDLENELLQNDITAEFAEDAFVNYLEKLDQVARLDIVGMYEENENGIYILHVFGRTVAIPHIYFYRRLEATTWTPWEKVELDIEGDHLIPVVWNRRLRLFWAIFTEKSDQPTKDQRANNEDPVKYWEIKLAWSEYKHKGWSAKILNKDILQDKINPSPGTSQQPKDYSFKTRIIDNKLRLQCYGTKFTKTEAIFETTTNSTTISKNSQFIKRFYKESHNRANYLYWLKFRKNGWNLLSNSDIADINLVFKGKNGAMIASFKLASNGDHPNFGEYAWITTEMDLYLESTTLQVDYISAVWPFAGGFAGEGVGISIDLKAWSPITSTTSVQTEKEPAKEIPDPMQSIGEFLLNECSNNLFLNQSPLSLIPIKLTPVQGTCFQNMEMVKSFSTTSNALMGAGAFLGQNSVAEFSLLMPHHENNSFFPPFLFPFFFKDQNRTYYVTLHKEIRGGIGGSGIKFRFNTFFHPRMCELVKSLKRYGLDGLLTLDNQLYTDEGAEFNKYQPNSTLVDLNSSADAIPREDIDFRLEGGYSLYNWELFFHIPFLIATQLSKNQRFEEAQKWFHYIFNPTSTTANAQGPERFWKVLPFYIETSQGVQPLEELLVDTVKFEQQVKEVSAKPFNPHGIARLRKLAYMKAVVMRYIDNLLAWGDQLFGRDTLESINEATQLYILAAEILGKRPDNIPARVTAKPQTYFTLYANSASDSLSNPLVDIENYIFPSSAPVADNAATPRLNQIPYFCTSPNDKLLSYWDKVADRLFKIRHCMNLAGIERTLPIYEPPIDPALLVKAAAAGVDLSSALSDINAPIPHYRFGVMLQKATELCNDVKSLGGALLSALEKRDAEALSLLRSSHEIDVLKAVRLIKEQQAKEASANLEGLNEYQKVITARQQYYQSRVFMNPFEFTHLALTTASIVSTTMQIGAEGISALVHLIPDTKAGGPTTAGTTFGGSNVAGAVQAFGSVAGTTASMLNTMGSMAATIGGFQRRQEDWTHQADLATKELKQVKKQIAAAEIRLAIAEQELKNHDLQTENAQDVDAFMRDKYTNRELYSWMVGQLSAVYFQSYQLAYDVAKRAERAYRFELGLRSSNFVQFGYWDSLKKGLLSGERLHLDLKRMDVAYLDQNRREHEIVKHVSLAMLDPMALIKLKQTQSCFISLPEVLFDLDHPGHYLRRIKSVSVSVPCVTGPYVGVHCTLTLLNSTVRHSNMLLSNKYERKAEDIRFTDSFGAIQSIVTSSGQNDSGLFETNLRDERFLPFEGNGVISEWRLQLPDTFHQFNYETISDVILHIRYTARDGGEVLATGAKSVLRSQMNKLRQLSETESGLIQMLSLRQEFPTEWNQLRLGQEGTTTIALNKVIFPYLMAGETINLIRFGALARVRTPATKQAKDGLKNFAIQITKNAGGKNPPSASLIFPESANLDDWRISNQGGELQNGNVIVTEDEQTSQWKIQITNDTGDLDIQKRELLEDIVLLVGYTL